ncbi:coiled-coil domain-containing protein 42 homolog isoform X1 [Rhynchophorus ferrugineus]|uniref:coiled-coil domain-containing protein 42 homolog isoform X1 n=1 Tax=Rhynchophorus ferrugineus TaxID=354439 RepID=UPI003FCEB2D3
MDQILDLETAPVPIRYSVKDQLLVDRYTDQEEKYIFNTKFPQKHVGDKSAAQHLFALTEKCPKENFPLEMNVTMNLAFWQMQLYKNEEILQHARLKMARQRRSIKRQWQALEKDEITLRQQFNDYDKFVKENAEKRGRAEKKIADDRNVIATKESEIQDYNDKIVRMQKAKCNMELTIKSYKKFRAYLQDVVNCSFEFKSVGGLLRRFQALCDAKELLSGTLKDNMEILEHAKLEMMKLIEEKNFIIMGLNNQIANLQARYENANIKALESETLVTQIKNNAVRQLSEINMVKNSIWNVYVHMAASKKHPIKIKRENVEEQMMYINRTLTELSKVNKLIKKRSTKIK